MKRTILESQIKDIESWGVLTLMQKLHKNYLFDLEEQEKTILMFRQEQYEGSSLEALCKLRDAYERKFDEQFKIVYDWMVEKSNKK